MVQNKMKNSMLEGIVDQDASISHDRIETELLNKYKIARRACESRTVLDSLFSYIPLFGYQSAEDKANEYVKEILCILPYGSRVTFSKNGKRTQMVIGRREDEWSIIGGPRVHVYRNGPTASIVKRADLIDIAEFDDMRIEEYESSQRKYVYSRS